MKMQEFGLNATTSSMTSSMSKNLTRYEPELVLWDEAQANVDQMPLKVKLKVPNAKMPIRASIGAAGYDLFAVKDAIVEAGAQELVPTGVAIEIPEGYYGQIKPRSGLALKKRISVNAGVIDRDYRGDIGVLIVNQSKDRFYIREGDRIAQLILVRISTPETIKVETLAETKRDEKGFGSTGEDEITINMLSAEQLKEIDINPSLSEGHEQAGKELLWEFRDLFANNLKELGQTDLVEHEIHLKPNMRPYYCPGNRRFAPIEMEEIQKSIKEEIEAGKIIEFDGPWCAPVVLAKKKDGSYRKCVAYNGLNERTERESWPLPNVEELLERMAGHKWYSTCDGYSGYYAVRIKPEDIAKTMFRTPYGTYAYTVMPFGLKNAPHTYSRLTSKAFAGLIGRTVEAYIDDNATYSNTFEEHLVDLRRTLEAALKAGIKLKAKKCHFFYNEVEFVGHIVGEFGLKMMPEKIEKVLTWPTPTTRSAIKGFLGLAGYYRRFIKDFARIASPLNKLTSLKVTFEWNVEQEQAFDNLKKALTEAPVLCRPDYSKDWTLEVDASDIALGAVLSQQQADTEIHPVYYWSRQLSKPERNYSVTDRECLAMVAACKKLRPYILGSRITIYGDHAAVKWIFNKPDASGKYARWMVTMSEFDYKIINRAGLENGNADALSRIPEVEKKQVRGEILFEQVVTVNKSKEDKLPGRRNGTADAHYAIALRQKWTENEWYKDVYLFLEMLCIEKDSAQERERVRRYARRFFVKDGTLYYRDVDKTPKRCLIQKETEMVLNEYHAGAIGGHFGRDITIKRIRQEYWWPTLWKDVADFIKSCH